MDSIRNVSEDLGKGVAETIRDHPIPSAIAGAALSWLAVAAIRDHRDRQSNGVDYRYDRHYAAHEQLEHGDDESSSIRDRARDAAETVSAAASATAEKAREVPRRVRETSAELYSKASEAGSVAATKLKAGARRSVDVTRETYHRHPLAMGGALLGVGILVGLAIPTSRREDALFGEKRDELLDKARDYGEEVVEKGKEVAKSAAQGAVKAAKAEVEEKDWRRQDEGSTDRETRTPSVHTQRDFGSSQTPRDLGSSQTSREFESGQAPRFGSGSEHSSSSSATPGSTRP